MYCKRFFYDGMEFVLPHLHWKFKINLIKISLTKNNLHLNFKYSNFGELIVFWIYLDIQMFKNRMLTSLNSEQFLKFSNASTVKKRKNRCYTINFYLKKLTIQNDYCAKGPKYICVYLIEIEWSHNVWIHHCLFR